MSQWESAPVVIDDNTRRFLDFLGKAEGADYNTIVGGKPFNDFSAHPNIVGLRTKEGPSTAAGRYQIVKTTYDDVAPKLGIKDFSPESQDRIAIELIRRSGALEDIQKGDYNAAIPKLGRTWASLPSSPYSQPKRSPEWVQQTLDALITPANAGEPKAPMASTKSTQATAPSKPAASDDGWESAPVKAAPSATSDDGWESAPAAPASTQATPRQGFGSFLLDEVKGLGRKADDLVRGAADMFTFGYADELAAKADALVGRNSVLNQSGGANYEEALKEQRQRDSEGGVARLIGQVGAGVTPVAAVVRAPAAASRGVRALYGALTGGVQGALYGSGSAEEGNRAQGAVTGGALGATLGGALGAVLPNSVKQEGTKIIKKAGSDKAAALDAEIIRDLNKVAGSANQRGNAVGATQLNALENRYIGDVTAALKTIGKNGLAKIGVNADDLTTALRDRRIIGEDELNALRSSKAGTALADAIEKAQRARSLTAATPSSGGVMPLVREANRWFLPERISTPLNAVLGGRQTREATAGRLVSPKIATAADDVLARLGPSDATRSLTDLQALANQARSQQAAQAQARAAAKAGGAVPKTTNPNTLVSELQGKDPTYLLGLGNQLGAPRNEAQMAEFSKVIRQQMEARAAKESAAKAAESVGQKAKTLGDAAAARRNLGLRGSPTGKAYQTILDYTGVSNEQAIPILRQLAKNPQNEIGTAAKQLLKSSDTGVENTQAFYQIQNILKDAAGTRGQGALAQATKDATKIVGSKGSDISRIIYGLPDDQVAALAGRSADTLGQPIANVKGYLTTRAARAFETAKKNPGAVLPEDKQLLKALGLVQ
jgi:muramidase (phage lysozyme)